MRMQDKVAIVTGAATGMGRAIAIAYAREGAKVVVNYSRSEKEANETLAEVRAISPASILFKADVSKADEVQAMVDRTVGEFGRVDVLVNNAGYTEFIAFNDVDKLTEEVWDRTFAVNLKGPWLCAKAVAPIMRRQGSGAIMSTASVAGLKPQGSSIAYAASKAALIMLTQTLAVALAPQVRVNCIAPGTVLTRWHKDMSPEGLERRLRNTPLERTGTPEDIAQVAVYLACGSDYVTGQTIAVDGGKR